MPRGARQERVRANSNSEFELLLCTQRGPRTHSSLDLLADVDDDCSMYMYI